MNARYYVVELPWLNVLHLIANITTRVASEAARMAMLAVQTCGIELQIAPRG